MGRGRSQPAARATGGARGAAVGRRRGAPSSSGDQGEIRGAQGAQSSSSAPALGMKRAIAASGRCAESLATSRKRAPVPAASHAAIWLKRGIICQRSVYWLRGCCSAPLPKESLSEMGRTKREQPDTGVVAPSSVTLDGWRPASGSLLVSPAQLKLHVLFLVQGGAKTISRLH